MRLTERAKGRRGKGEWISRSKTMCVSMALMQEWLLRRGDADNSRGESRLPRKMWNVHLPSGQLCCESARERTLCLRKAVKGKLITNHSRRSVLRGRGRERESKSNTIRTGASPMQMLPLLSCASLRCLCEEIFALASVQFERAKQIKLK